MQNIHPWLQDSATVAKPGLAEDYAEIVDEEGDYSSPARDYELDRGRIELSEIIGEGQVIETSNLLITLNTDL